jgi:peptidyl-prolyl cis-trans isomerase A (cyclophilin A)
MQEAEDTSETSVTRTLTVATLVLTVIVAACGASSAQKASGLLDPAGLTEQAPPTFQVAFDTSKGRFVIEVHREWAPIGVDRFYNLVKSGFFDDVRFFRVVSGQLAQFGMHGDPEVQAAWRDAAIQDDPVRRSNIRGTLSFATRGPASRTTQLFVNLRDNSLYDRLGFAPFAQVVSGMEVVDNLYAGYEERPEQPRIDAEGNAYLTREFPNLDYVQKATITPD